jgi:hypothetical protein
VAKQQPESRFTLLYDKVCRQDILPEAWQRVKSNKGAAGVDEVDIDEIREYGEARFLGEIEQELRDGSYRVSLVRRVHIEKPGQPGKTRPLGIPTVKDRTIQMAVKLVIEPLFEADFVPCSFGFRPEKTPRMALSIMAPTQTPMQLAVGSEHAARRRWPGSWMREIRTSSSMRGRRKRATAQRACALLYRSPCGHSPSTLFQPLPGSKTVIWRASVEVVGPRSFS